MKNKGFLLFFAFFFVFLGVLPAGAQQEGSVAIAGSIRPTDDTTLADFTKCVADLKEAGVKDKAAIKACTKIASIAAETSKRIANEAADATKASRPLVLGGYGYGYGYGYGRGYHGGYHYRSYGYSHRVRSHPRRVVVHREPRSRRPASPRR